MSAQHSYAVFRKTHSPLSPSEALRTASRKDTSFLSFKGDIKAVFNAVSLNESVHCIATQYHRVTISLSERSAFFTEMRGDDALSTDDQTTSAKKVSWETLEKLCQVRLFAAEDAPLLSGTMLQELYQPKETKFLHVVKPVSENDLPPGFVSFANKPAGVDASSDVGMEAQVQWRCPEKFLYKLGWQVAAGDGSLLVLTEHKRELGALQVIYTLCDALPPSPEEPEETVAEVEDHTPPVIPLFCVEDDDELEEGSNPGTSVKELSNIGIKLEGDTLLSQSLKMGSKKNDSVEKPGGTSASTWQAAQLDQETSTSCLADAGPNVAAAAAAAYAVLKAKERGTLVDHDLLIKILTNPILIKTLLAANQNLPNQAREFLRAISEEAQDGCYNNELAAGRGTSSGVGSNMFPSPMQPGCKATALAVDNMQGVREATNSLPWNTVGHHEGARPFIGPNQVYGQTEMLGQGKGALGGFPDMEPIGNSKLVPLAEMLRAPFLGAFSQPGLRNQVTPSSHGRNDCFPQSRIGGEVSQSRFQKPCLYFNTPKGCRRGTSCFYLHNTAPEQTCMEQTWTDFFQFHQSKRPKFGVPDKE